MGHRNPLWDITEIIYQVDCLDVSKMTDAKTGEEYLGAIACGRIVSEPGFPERNFDVGEYGCMAFQERTTSPEQMQSSFIGPCQYIQLGECQCAPPMCSLGDLIHQLVLVVPRKIVPFCVPTRVLPRPRICAMPLAV